MKACGAVGKKDIPLLELYNALDKYDDLENGEDVEPSKTSLVIDLLSAIAFDFDNMVNENMIGIYIWICSAATEVVEDHDLLPGCLVKLQDAIRNINHECHQVSYLSEERSSSKVQEKRGMLRLTKLCKL